MKEGGRVSFVGIGSGDPRHLTYAAGEVLASADIIIAPPDLPADLLSLFRRSPLTSVGDPMDPIRRAIRDDTHLVWVFRGSPWETGLTSAIVESVASLGAPIEVIEGVSLAATGRTAGGVALSESATTLEVKAGGHTDLDAVAAHLNNGQNLQILGSHDDVSSLVSGLLERGCGPLPAVAVTNPGTSGQHSSVASLEAIDLPVSSRPIVLFAGARVSRRETLGWFERRPLFGRSIVVTRPRHQAQAIAVDLRKLGATVLVLPIIRIADPAEPQLLVDAAREIGTFDWIVFTSANGVERFWEALGRAGLDTRALGGVKICAIGPATGEAVLEHGAGVDLLPEEYVAESVIKALRDAADLPGKRILLPRAAIARDVLPTTLAELGAEVTEVPVYRTLADEEGVAGLRKVVREGGVDMVTFTSSSTVRNFAELVSEDIGSIGVASIGPITSATAREYGWPIAIEAAEHTADGLVEAITAHYQGAQE